MKMNIAKKGRVFAFTVCLASACNLSAPGCSGLSMNSTKLDFTVPPVTEGFLGTVKVTGDVKVDTMLSLNITSSGDSKEYLLRFIEAGDLTGYSITIPVPGKYDTEYKVRKDGKFTLLFDNSHSINKTLTISLAISGGVAWIVNELERQPAKTPVPRLWPPTRQELINGHFAYPEIPRITAQKLNETLEAAEANKAYAQDQTRPWETVWNDFVLLDVRPESGVDDMGIQGTSRGYIKGSMFIPFTFYWVNDPAKDVVSEEEYAYTMEQRSIEDDLFQIPKDKMIIIYDDTSNDLAACLMAKKLINAGYSPENIQVLWKGFGHWNELGYLYVIEEWMPAG
jgi:hypothetical protein